LSLEEGSTKIASLGKEVCGVKNHLVVKECETGKGERFERHARKTPEDLDQGRGQGKMTTFGEWRKIYKGGG